MVGGGGGEGGEGRSQVGEGDLSSESFSESALRALNISTTTSTVMATVMGSLLLKASHPVVHLEEVSRSPHDICGPFCIHIKKVSCLFCGSLPLQQLKTHGLLVQAQFVYVIANSGIKIENQDKTACCLTRKFCFGIAHWDLAWIKHSRPIQ